jgi:hypothetical protein
MITWIYEGILRLCKFADDHRTFCDLGLGGLGGLVHGVVRYWHHFTQEDNLFIFIDGIVRIAAHTIVGAVVLFLAHKFLKPEKKNGITKDRGPSPDFTEGVD